MVKDLQKNLNLTAVDIFKDRNINHNDVCVVTMKNYLHEKGWQVKVKTKVPVISEITLKKKT